MSTVLRISEAASLAFHTMALLATEHERPLTTHEIASAFDVSQAHLAKVLQRLAHAGLVRSARGPRGGFTLARPAEGITLLDVYETIEGPLTPSDCLLGSKICGGEACIFGSLV